jgi:LPS export ABC transporter protein LptC
MVSFQLRQNLLITAFIIAIIGFVWLLMLLLSYSFPLLGNQQALLVQSKTTFSEVAYIEKIDNFVLQEFDAKARLSHFVKAKSYFSFKNSPALLIEPEVTLYDEKGLKDYVLNSKRAHYTDSGEIKFKGEVSIQSSNGLKYKINAEELLVGIKTHDLISKKPVTYLGENVKIISQGIHMHTKDDIIRLIGRTKINQNNGQQILTKNLTIDQSNGLEVYRTKEKIHYQSNIANIHALGMNYDLIKQKIKLTGGVVGRYE